MKLLRDELSPIGLHYIDQQQNKFPYKHNLCENQKKDMLTSIRTDLRALYTTVKHDTYEKVKVSSDLSKDLKEFYADFESLTSNAVKQVTNDTIKVLDKLDDKLASELLISWDYQDAVQEADCRRDMEDTYLASLLKPREMPNATDKIESKESMREFEAAETRVFLESFNLKQRTDEIVAILEQHPATVKVHFEALVPVHVSYKDFWQRYFFRCNTDRIVRVWVANDKRIRSARKAAMSTVKKTLTAPVSFVVMPLMRADSLDYEEAELEAQFRMAMEEIYQTPLLKSQLAVEGTSQCKGEAFDLELEAKETQVFLESFDISEKTEEIVALLDKHPDTLKARFDELVPLQVSYEDFWERYFFRCDVNRIVRVWTAEEERTRAAQNEAIGAWSKSLSKPVAMFTGQVKSAIATISRKLDARAEGIKGNNGTLEGTENDALSAEASISDLNDTMQTLRDKLDETRKCLANTRKRVDGLKTDLRTAQNTLRRKGHYVLDEMPEVISVCSDNETADLTDTDESSVDNSFSS
jgi:hypothetical protein